MRFITTILFSFLIGFCAVAEAQENHGLQGLLAQAEQLVPENPGQALKIGGHLLRNAGSDADNCNASFLIAKSYFAQGNNNQALNFAFRAKQKAEDAGLQEQIIRTSIFIAEVLQVLQLEQQSAKYIQDAVSCSENANWTNWIAGKSLSLSAWASLENRKPKEALQSFQKADVAFSKFSGKESGFLRNETTLGKARAFALLGQNDSATYYFDRSLAYLLKENPHHLLGIAHVYKESARLYFQQQQHEKAITALLKALKIAEKLHHPELLRDINKQLAINYLARNDRSNFHVYNQKFLALSSEIENQENEATNTAFNLISQEQERRLDSGAKTFANIFYAALACSLLILIFGGIQLYRNQSKQKRYSEILKYLESGRNPMILAAVPAKKEVSKNLFIPAETEQNILSKLKKFEASVKFTNKEMSLAMLAAQLDTNTKYLSEIINKHYQDNFNTYINKLRVNYIIEKMKSEPAYLNYKISYLAEESGFSSHSSFATIFKSITGIAPTTFIDFLKEESISKINSQ